jgi:hypothetical protein
VGFEVQAFMEVKVKSDMMVDIEHMEEKLNIIMDIEFPRLPCGIISLDIEDIMGTHMVDVHN